jgi:hypothetical protein
MVLNGKALPPYKEHDRPEEGRSWVNVVAGARFEAEKKIPGRVVEFTYLAGAVEVAQRKAILLAA